MARSRSTGRSVSTSTTAPGRRSGLLVHLEATADRSPSPASPPMITRWGSRSVGMEAGSSCRSPNRSSYPAFRSSCAIRSRCWLARMISSARGVSDGFSPAATPASWVSALLTAAPSRSSREDRPAVSVEPGLAASQRSPSRAMPLNSEKPKEPPEPASRCSPSLSDCSDSGAPLPSAAMPDLSSSSFFGMDRRYSRWSSSRAASTGSVMSVLFRESLEREASSGDERRGGAPMSLHQIVPARSDDRAVMVEYCDHRHTRPAVLVRHGSDLRESEIY